MKIGILTHPLHYNYGGILQAWALQHVLMEMGHEPVKIDYYCWYRPDIDAKIFLMLLFSWFKTVIAKIFGHRQYLALASPYTHIFRHDQIRCVDRKFVKRISSTSRFYDYDELLRKVEDGNFDAFVVGSDQVWRQAYCPDIKTFFLGFMSASDHRPRIAYAASFGTSTSEIDRFSMESCIKLLHRFDAVSVREKSGVDIVKDCFHRADVSLVLDPTLLLDADVYRRLVRKPVKLNDKPLIAAYILDPDSRKNFVMEDAAAALGADVVKMTCNPGNGLQMPTVDKWISNFDKSDFVITDSFHGCVFAIIFRKPFIAIGNEWRGLDRFQSLLDTFGICDRLVNNSDEYISRKQELLMPIDYDRVHRRLNTLREYSLDFLKNALA